MKTPYIGITDFTSAEQVRNMLAVFSASRRGATDRKLMPGVMTSYKVINGLPTKWSSAFPKPEQIKDIFLRTKLLFNTLHYADYEGLDVFQSLIKATILGGPNMDALQLDMIWPNPYLIKEYRELYPKVQIVIQVNRIALEQVNDNPGFLVNKLKEYGDSIDYALLDKSGGRGLGMDEKVLRPFVQELAERMPELGIAVAGGLGPNAIHLVEGLARDYPHISIDAQGQLRPSGSALDPIDWNMAAEYIRKAMTIFQ